MWPHAEATGGDANPGNRNLQKHLDIFKNKSVHRYQPSLVSSLVNPMASHRVLFSDQCCSRGHVYPTFDLMTKVIRVMEIWNHKEFKLTDL